MSTTTTTSLYMDLPTAIARHDYKAVRKYFDQGGNPNEMIGQGQDAKPAIIFAIDQLFHAVKAVNQPFSDVNLAMPNVTVLQLDGTIKTLMYKMGRKAGVIRPSRQELEQSFQASMDILCAFAGIADHQGPAQPVRWNDHYNNSGKTIGSYVLTSINKALGMVGDELSRPYNKVPGMIAKLMGQTARNAPLNLKAATLAKTDQRQN